MSEPLAEPLDAAEWARVLEQRIARRTWGRIRQLRVEATAERVTVRGFTQLYYLKQLALQVVLEAVGAADSRIIEVDILVGRTLHSEARP